MKINNLSFKYKEIWEKSLPLLKQGRPGDDLHAKEVTEFVNDYTGNIKIDKDILIPVAIMHDIGHSMILSEHFKYVTGPEKLINGKLAHMLVGAKIADNMLSSVNYDKEKIKEIVDIISIHDTDQLKDIDINKFYNTENKKIFHDIDSMDRFTEERIKSVSFVYKDRKKLMDILRESLSMFFYEEFRKIAEERLNTLIIPQTR